MLFRVGLVTILLLALFVTELGQPGGPAFFDDPVQRVVLSVVIGAYLLTLVYAVLLRYLRDLERFAVAQIAIDLVGVSVLVLYTGAPDSIFGFAYLLVIVGASIVLPIRAAAAMAGLAVLLFVAASLGAWAGLGGEEHGGPLRHLVRSLLIHGVAMIATAVLAVRLAVELERASERIASQHTSLHDLATLHREVIQSLQSGLITVDMAGRVATLNAAAADILRVEAEAAEGQPVMALLPDIAPYLASADLGAIAARLELRVRVPALPGMAGHSAQSGPSTQSGPPSGYSEPGAGGRGGDRILGVTVSRLVDHKGALIGRLINFQDLTDLRRAEEAAKQADRLAVIGRMAATVAHEIRNPLAAICGSVELLGQLLPPGPGDEARDLMQIVTREGERLDGLITDLLAYASPRPLLRTRVDLAQEVGQIVQVFEYDKRIGDARFKLVRADTAFAEVDPSRLRQVMWNLLRNAVEANPGGLVEISVVADRGARRGHIIIRDHGPGISEETRPHLFEPFFTTKQSGTGLGLATVHRIVEEHGGHVDLRNAAGGGGAESVVTLPLRPDAPSETSA